MGSSKPFVKSECCVPLFFVEGGLRCKRALLISSSQPCPFCTKIVGRWRHKCLDCSACEWFGPSGGHRHGHCREGAKVCLYFSHGKYLPPAATLLSPLSSETKWGGIYHNESGELTALQNEAWGMFNCSNTLYPEVNGAARVEGNYYLPIAIYVSLLFFQSSSILLDPSRSRHFQAFVNLRRKSSP